MKDSEIEPDIEQQLKELKKLRMQLKKEDWCFWGTTIG